MPNWSSVIAAMLALLILSATASIFAFGSVWHGRFLPALFSCALLLGGWYFGWRRRDPVGPGTAAPVSARDGRTEAGAQIVEAECPACGESLWGESGERLECPMCGGEVRLRAVVAPPPEPLTWRDLAALVLIGFILASAGTLTAIL